MPPPDRFTPVQANRFVEALGMTKLLSAGEQVFYEDKRDPNRIMQVEQRRNSTVILLMRGCEELGYTSDELDQALSKAMTK